MSPNLPGLYSTKIKHDEGFVTLTLVRTPAYGSTLEKKKKKKNIVVYIVVYRSMGYYGRGFSHAQIV